MPENNEEKLLGSGEPRPLLSTREFLKTTPHHELKNVFGISKENRPVELSALPGQKSTPPFLPPVFKNTSKETSESTDSSVRNKPGPMHRSYSKIATTFLLIFIITIIALYIWGGVVKT